MKDLYLLSALLVTGCDIVSNSHYVTPSGMPTITSIEKSSGTTWGGTVLAIKGTNLTTGMKVLVDGLPATEVTLIDAMNLTAKTPKACGPAREAMVSVADANNNVLTSANQFSFSYTSTQPHFASHDVLFGANRSDMFASAIAIGSLNPENKQTDVVTGTVNDGYFQVCPGIAGASVCEMARSQGNISQGTDIVRFGNFSDAPAGYNRDILLVRRNYNQSYVDIALYDQSRTFAAAYVNPLFGTNIVDVAVDNFISGGNSSVAVLLQNDLFVWSKPSGQAFHSVSDTVLDKVYLNTAMDSGDVDNNGLPDVVTASLQNLSAISRLTVFQVLADGSLKPRIDTSLGARGKIAKIKIIPPRRGGSVYPELAVMFDSGMLFMATPNPDMTINVSTTRLVGTYLTNFMLASDFDCDGAQDIFVQSTDNTAKILGNGASSYGYLSGVPTAALGAIVSAAAGDVNEDGKPDIVYSVSSAGATTAKLTVWLNDSP